jgi:hypothetical protein
MASMQRLLVAAVMTCVGIASASAASVIYDFQGTGTASAYGVLSFPDHDQVNFNNYTGVLVSGWISIDLGASNPNEFHFVASGGTQTGCLAAPASSSLTLHLPQIPLS